MNEDVMKRILKKIKANETKASFFLGVLAVVAGVYIAVPYLQRTSTPYISPYGDSELTLTEELPVSPSPDMLPTGYIVKEGDSTWDISEAFYGSGFNYVDIETENNLVKDQDLTVGLYLVIPAVQVRYSEGEEIQGGVRTHLTSSTDTLWSIAQQYYSDGFQWTKIYEANRQRIPNPDILEANVRLVIP